MASDIAEAIVQKTLELENNKSNETYIFIKIKNEVRELIKFDINIKINIKKINKFIYVRNDGINFKFLNNKNLDYILKKFWNYFYNPYIKQIPRDVQLYMDMEWVRTKDGKILLHDNFKSYNCPIDSLINFSTLVCQIDIDE